MALNSNCMKKKINSRYSAPAKVILTGEHAVVYGKPALVSAIDLRLTATAKFTDSIPQEKGVHAVYSAVTSYLKKQSITYNKNPVTIHTSTKIPTGRGLGSSAAFSVASVAAILDLVTDGVSFSNDIINSIAYQVEKKFHANPSGVDNSASSLGGLIFYRKEFEFLKFISSLPYKIPDSIQSHLYLIDTGKAAESTAEMVNFVGKEYNNNPQRMEQLLMQIEKTSKRLVVSLIKEDPDFFCQCLEKNEKLLEEIGIVSKNALQMKEQLLPYGIGKITGAGGRKKGSGFMLFYARNPDEFESSTTYKYMKFTQSFEGVKKIT